MPDPSQADRPIPPKLTDVNKKPIMNGCRGVLNTCLFVCQIYKKVDNI